VVCLYPYDTQHQLTETVFQSDHLGMTCSTEGKGGVEKGGEMGNRRGVVWGSLEGEVNDLIVPVAKTKGPSF